MNAYTVVSAVMGECCSKMHVWQSRIKARTEQEAIKKAEKKLKRQRYDYDEVVIIRKEKA